MYCEPKVYGTYEDPLAIVDSFETFLLLAGYLGYIILCAVYARIMDKCCPSYGGADQIGFAEMGAATTSFDAQDKTNRPSVDGFEAYKKNRQLQNRRTVVARQLVGSILRGEAEYSELIGKEPAQQEGYEADHSESLAGARSSHTAKDIMDSKLFNADVHALDEIEEGDEEGGHAGGEGEDGHGDHEHEEHVVRIPAVSFRSGGGRLWSVLCGVLTLGIAGRSTTSGRSRKARPRSSGRCPSP